MSLGELADDGPAELLGLATEFEHRVERELAELSQLVQAAQRAPLTSHSAVDVREVLADFDGRLAEIVTLRREIIGQIDATIAAEGVPWERPWLPPLVQTGRPAATRSVSASSAPIFGRFNRAQVARMLTVVGTVLVLVGLYLGFG